MVVDVKILDDAMFGLRGWRSAGEQYANRGGRIETLDYQVDVALDEIEFQRDPDRAVYQEIERPDAEQLAWAMEGMRQHFDDGSLGEDLRIVLSFLEQPSLFTEQEMDHVC